MKMGDQSKYAILLVAAWVFIGCDNNPVTPIDTTGPSIDPPPVDTVAVPQATGGKVAFTVYDSTGGISVFLGDYFNPAESYRISHLDGYHEPKFSNSGQLISLSPYYLSHPGNVYRGGERDSIESTPHAYFFGFSLTWDPSDEFFYFDEPNGFVSTFDVLKYQLSTGDISEISRSHGLLSDFRGDSLLVHNSEGLFALHPETGIVRRLTNPFFDSTIFLGDADWSPSMDLLAVVAADLGQPFSYIALVSPDGDFQRRVTNETHRVSHPRFGPEGFLLFDRLDPGDNLNNSKIMKYSISSQTLSIFLNPFSIDGAIGVGGIDYTSEE